MVAGAVTLGLASSVGDAWVEPTAAVPGMPPASGVETVRVRLAPPPELERSVPGLRNPNAWLRLETDGPIGAVVSALVPRWSYVPIPRADGRDLVRPGDVAEWLLDTDPWLA